MKESTIRTIPEIERKINQLKSDVKNLERKLKYYLKIFSIFYISDFSMTILLAILIPIFPRELKSLLVLLPVGFVGLLLFIIIAGMYSMFWDKKWLIWKKRREYIRRELINAVEILKAPEGESKLTEILDSLLRSNSKFRKKVWLDGLNITKKQEVESMRESEARIQAFSWVLSPGGLPSTLDN